MDSSLPSSDMTDTDGTAESGSTSQERPSGGLDALIDQVADTCKRLARAGAQAVTGDYSLNDAFADWDDWVSSSARYAVGVADELWGRPARPSRFTGTWSATMTVLPSVTKRPLALRSTGLSADDTDFRIDPSNVAFEPAVLQPGCDTFQVTVWTANAPRDKAYIFEGQIVDDETGDPVTDPILASNVDGGAVR
jgi:hypothetical protein